MSLFLYVVGWVLPTVIFPRSHAPAWEYIWIFGMKNMFYLHIKLVYAFPRRPWEREAAELIQSTT